MNRLILLFILQHMFFTRKEKSYLCFFYTFFNLELNPYMGPMIELLCHLGYVCKCGESIHFFVPSRQLIRTNKLYFNLIFVQLFGKETENFDLKEKSSLSFHIIFMDKFSYFCVTNLHIFMFNW